MGQARICYPRMRAGMERMPQIEENVENDQLNIESYVKEVASVCKEMFKAAGATFEQEHLNFISMITASRSGAPNGGGHHKTIVESKVIQNVRSINGDKSFFRQWRQKFTTALGQVAGAHEEIVHRSATEIDLGKSWRKW